MMHFFKRSWIVIIVIAAVTVFFALQLPKAEMDNNIVHFMPENNPARLTVKRLDEMFGERAAVFIGLKRSYGSVFDRDFLMRIRDFTQAAENIELVKDTDSIISTRYISGEGDSIIVSDLVKDDFSGTAEEISELKRRIASWDLYQRTIVSDDLLSTQIVVFFDASPEDQGIPGVQRSLVEVSNLAKEMFAGFAEVYTAGQPVIGATLTSSMRTDLRVLIPLVIVVVLAVLFLSLRQVSFVILTLLTVVIAVIWAVGAMPFFGIKLSVLSSVLPVILVAVGSAYGIHIVTHYAHETENKILTREEHGALVLSIAGKLIKPVFLAALTTFAGFVSLCFTTVLPIREFGMFASFGVVVSFIVAISLIPAILIIRGPAKKAGRYKSSVGKSGALDNTFMAIAGKKGLVFVLAVAALGVSLYGLSKVVVDNSLVEFFHDHSEVSRSDRFIREYFGGSKQITLLVEADNTETLLGPEALKAVDDLSVYLTERVPLVGKVMGFTDMIKRMNQLFNIDEGPGGLRPAASHAGEDQFGFNGTEESFGFGFDGAAENGFGFGFDGVSEIPSPETPLYAGVEDTPRSPSQYGAEDIISLLDTARGKRVNMTAGELVRELERLTNYNGFSYYEIPADPARYAKKSGEELGRLISNYLVLLAGDIEDYSNDPLEPTAIKTTVQIRSPWQKDVDAVVDAINAYTARNFPGNIRVVIGGGAMAEGALSKLIIHSQISSIAISILVVFIIITISNRSLSAGLIAAVPLSLAILCNFAIMGFLDIKINLGTALISGLAVGIGIDYTIHFIEFFKHEYQKGGDFLRRTYIGTGKAIVINALSVGTGFGILVFSRFKIIAQLGVLVMFSMFITALVSLTVIPVLLALVKPKFIYGERGEQK
ncbi:MAG: MMPL family transporter [Treponema sp.]|jgi:predicted RND superfamily exporter protein|nr:MMPL family transporter [Treponema sp.]